MKRIERWTMLGSKFSFNADPGKNLKAFGKHGITLRKASEIFIKGRPRLERLDYKDNHSEPRRVATGFIRNKDGRVGAVTVAFIKDGKNIRMITAQPASNAEKNALRFAMRIAKNKQLLRGEVNRDLGRTAAPQSGKKAYKTQKSAVQKMREQSGKKYNAYVEKGIKAEKKHADPSTQKRMQEAKQENMKRWAEKRKQVAERMRGRIDRDFKGSEESGRSKQYRIIDHDSPWKDKNREP